jgi:cephalosporin hydroxylase
MGLLRERVRLRALLERRITLRAFIKDQTRHRGLPPPVEVHLSSSVHDYWIDRVRQHTRDSYVGVPLSKFPEDLRVYEHLLWMSRANVVIEIGGGGGGSALWFRDRLRTMAAYKRITSPKVISIDINVPRANLKSADPSYSELIEVIEADVMDDALPATIEELVPDHSRCFVVEDSAHTYETTSAALRGFARFVPVGGFFVVEDGSVDVQEMRASEGWPRGVLPALHDWLGTTEGARFRVRRDLELYGVSCHPEGFLQRISPD